MRQQQAQAMHMHHGNSAARLRSARTARMAIAAGLLAATVCGSAWSQGNGTAASQYAQDRKDCMAGNTWEDQRTCLREAGAAQQAARSHDLSNESEAQLEKNRLARCNLQPEGADRDECVRRMQDGTTTGSVAGGGVLREHRYTVPAGS